MTVGAPPWWAKGLFIGAAVVGVKEKVEPPLAKEGAFEAGALKLKLKLPALGGDVTGAEGCGLEGNVVVLPKKLDVFPNTGAVDVCCAPNGFCSGGFAAAVAPKIGPAVVEPNV